MQKVKYFADRNKYPKVKVFQEKIETIYSNWQHCASWEL